MLRDGSSSSSSKRKLSSSVRTGDSGSESSAGKRRNKVSSKRKSTQKYKGKTKVQKGDELKAEDMSLDSKSSESVASSFSEPLPTLLTPQQTKVSYTPTLTQRLEEAVTSLMQAKMDAEAEGRTFHSSYSDLVGRSLTSTQAVKSIVSSCTLKLLCCAQKVSTTLVAALLSPYQQFMPTSFAYDFTVLLDTFPSALSKSKQLMCSLAELFTTTQFSSIESSLYSACQDHTEQRYTAVIVEVLVYIRDLKQSLPPSSSSSSAFCSFCVSGPGRVFNCASEYLRVVRRSTSTTESESSQLLVSTIHLTKSLCPLDKFLNLVSPACQIS